MILRTFHATSQRHLSHKLHSRPPISLFLFRFGPHTRRRRCRKIPVVPPPAAPPAAEAAEGRGRPSPPGRSSVGLRCRCRRHPRRYHALPHLVSADRCGLLTHSLVQRARPPGRPAALSLSLLPTGASAPCRHSPPPPQAPPPEVGGGGGGGCSRRGAVATWRSRAGERAATR